MAAAATHDGQNTGDPLMAANARYSLPASRNGAVARGGGLGGPRPGASPAVLPHIEDILAVLPTIDPNASIKRLLDEAQVLLRTAELSRDFKRLDQALKDFLCAYIIIIKYIPAHKEFSSMAASQKSAWTSIRDKSTGQSDSFTKIKDLIKEDNARSKVKPTGPQIAAIPTSPLSDVPVESSHNSHHSTEKRKPAIQPKPPALHGNAIPPNGQQPKASQLSSDLLGRFRSLGGPQPSPGQDPRIRTHSIDLPTPPKPSGPRKMPRPEKLKLDNSTSSLPKMPDATYSPARANATGEGARIPPTTPRTVADRTGPTSSSMGHPPAPQTQPNTEYFALPQNNANALGAPGRLSNDLGANGPPSPSSAITAEQLTEMMKSQKSILLIDVRHRDAFDEGHIMHPNIMCIEPSVLMRGEVSSDDIEDSLVVSPSSELNVFKRRAQVDFVVFYDQDTDSIARRPNNSDDLALQSLYRALVQLSYGRELKRTPQLLKGGLDAWTELMGPRSLQSTSDRPVQRKPSKHVPTFQRPEEIREFTQRVDEEQFNYAHNADDFLRRHPNLPRTTESMASPTPAPFRTSVSAPAPPRAQPPSLGRTQFDTLPQPPAPTVARPWYSSSTHGTNEFPAPDDEGIKPLSRTRTLEPGALGTKNYLTGLSNPHNWCYANSLIQSLAASPQFGRELADSVWIKKYIVPRRTTEKIDQPQLMTRILSNLFHWMNSGKLQTMKAQTLMDYSRSVCTQNLHTDKFGDAEQHDADEFRAFLMDNIADETNIHRDKPLDISIRQTGDLMADAAAWWREHKTKNDSLMDKYWRGLTVNRKECKACGDVEHNFSQMQGLVIYHDESCKTLNDAIEHTYQLENVDVNCEKCKHKQATLQSRLARMPPLLSVTINRAGARGRDPRKLSWNFDDIDFSEWFLWPHHRNNRASAGGDTGLEGPFRYECYAVVCHQGNSLNSGHYTAYVRETGNRDPHAWVHFDDHRVNPVRIGGGKNDIKERVFGDANAVPYILFFRRITGRGDGR